MSQQRLPLLWIILHSLLILIVFISLLTGLRIAIVSHDNLDWLSPMLPQGYVHQAHVLSGFGLTALTLLYFLALFTLKDFPKAKKKPSKNLGKNQGQPRRSANQHYHQWVTWYGYLVLLTIMLSGLALYFEIFDSQVSANLHFYTALGLVLYLILHSAVYFVQYGMAVIKRIFIPSKTSLKPTLVMSFILVALYLCGSYLLSSNNTTDLTVKPIDISQMITIDGVADEPEWHDAQQITVSTHGGANFVNGQTDISVKVLSNGQEAFFHIKWQDPTQSLKHLPLIKDKNGWRVQHDGFEHFDERTHYEDKLAVLLSETCRIGADGTAHLGRKPLTDKPANWHGKGYHYTTDGSVKDMWHWKAVRTNDMKQADDNFFGPPLNSYSGNRRYKGGYGQDGKESGSYVMNWTWFKTDTIQPKRLPQSPSILEPFQASSSDSPQSWVIPWFQYKPYQADNDHYPVGTEMPSVMYRSNQFEGDRADVRAFGTWSDGKWSLELSRKLNTNSKYDVEIKDGVCLWVSAFDHSQVAHTRHNRPIKLRFRKTD